MRRLNTCLFAIALIAASGCGRSPKEPKAMEPYVFTIPTPPMSLDDEGKAAYLRLHYWDRFDFSDTTILARFDSTKLARAFVQFVELVAEAPSTAPMDSLAHKAAGSRAMMEQFFHLSESILHDPNSQWRSDPLYISVLKEVVASPFFSDSEKMRPSWELEMCSKNLPGSTAADFEYAVADGTVRHMHSLACEYLLIFFNNPGCTMCKDLHDQICSSQIISYLLREKRLAILALYPDEDLQGWRDYAPNIPKEWINAYSPMGAIREDNSYDLNAIPSLYLLDRNKTVLVKDASEVESIERVLISAIPGQR